MKMALPLPASRPICRMASMKGWPSISPMVPPISVISTSAPVRSARARMLPFISSVMCGMVWTVLPRYSPRRSFWMTEE